MELFFLRHGIAEAQGARYPADGDRPLTAEGKWKIRRAAKGMKRLKLSFDAIVSSPYVRARQTAEIAAEVLRQKKKLAFCEHLVPQGRQEKAVDFINGSLKSAERVLLVGHEPFLSEMVSVLTTGGKSLSLDFKKGGVCKLTAETLKYGKCADLDWLLTPKQLMALA